LSSTIDAAEVGSSGAFAGTGSFQKLVGEKKRNGSEVAGGVSVGACSPGGLPWLFFESVLSGGAGAGS
jgi:hypothetical protein